MKYETETQIDVIWYINFTAQNEYVNNGESNKKEIKFRGGRL